MTYTTTVKNVMTTTGTGTAGIVFASVNIVNYWVDIYTTFHMSDVYMKDGLTECMYVRMYACMFVQMFVHANP